MAAHALDLRAPMAAQVVQWLVQPGDVVRAGTLVLVLEAMKMEHELHARTDLVVQALHVAPGDAVNEGDVLWTAASTPVLASHVESKTIAFDSYPALATGQNSIKSSLEGPLPAMQAELTGKAAASTRAFTPDGVVDVRADLRTDLQAVRARHALTLDAARPAAMAKRHALGLRSARENIADLCDAGSFIEYGALAVAAQASRRSADDLMRNTPADGMVTGIGGVNGAHVGPERARTVVMAYDATVLAGTQGMRNHQKTDRLLGIALQQRLPVVLFAEGGGGRPGDTDMPIVAGLHVSTFTSFARLHGQVPVLGIAAGRCFAGNAALLGCCDLIVATQGSNIGMGGPAMVEGGGMGVFRPEDIGPADVQHRNGVIDILVDNEAQAVAATRQALGYFQGVQAAGAAPDTRSLRDVVPENRVRAYDTRAALHGLVDVGSLLLLRDAWGRGVHTAFARIEGHPIGVLANNPSHLGGAVDADAAEKAAQFLHLCNRHGLPVLSLVDTPGFMVGPDIEARAQVRHAGHLFQAAARLRVPSFSVVLRKGYGLGAMAMCAGGFHAPAFTVAWPTAEFGAMGLEGAVKLGYRKELEAVPDGPERQALYERLVAEQYARGSALNMAATLEIDAVIDPAETRDWLVRGLQGARRNAQMGAPTWPA